MTEKDIDMFYDIIKYKTDDIINKIGPSEFYTLVMEAREENLGQDEWIDMISNYVTINNVTTGCSNSLGTSCRSARRSSGSYRSCMGNR